jgi:hypothetical protein
MVVKEEHVSFVLGIDRLFVPVVITLLRKKVQ